MTMESTWRRVGEIVLEHIDDPDYYEEGEPRPALDVVGLVMTTLKQLPADLLEGCYASTFWGEIHACWHENSDRHATAMFTKDRRIMVWWGQMADKRVAESGMHADATPEQIADRIRWTLLKDTQ